MQDKEVFDVCFKSSDWLLIVLQQLLVWSLRINANYTYIYHKTGIGIGRHRIVGHNRSCGIGANIRHWRGIASYTSRHSPPIQFSCACTFLKDTLKIVKVYQSYDNKKLLLTLLLFLKTYYKEEDCLTIFIGMIERFS